MLIIYMKKKYQVILNMKMFIHLRLIMEELIDYILNYVMLIVRNVIYLECLIIIKNVFLAWKNILMII